MSSLDVAMYAVLFAVCGGAIAKGQWPERVVGGAVFANFALNFVPTALFLLGRSKVGTYSADLSLVIDLALFAVLLGVAVSARPAWTLFTAAFQLLATLTSFVRFAAEDVNLVAYVTAQNIFWWLTMCTLAYGLWETLSKAPGAAVGSGLRA